MLLGYVYMSNNFVRLRGYPTHGDAANVKSLLFLFCVYMIKGENALTEIFPFEVTWMKKNWYKDCSQPVEARSFEHVYVKI